MTDVRNVVLNNGAERVAVLDTGIMGAPMACNLLKAGFQVRVWNRTTDKARVLAAEGAELGETPADAVRAAAFVITMLTDTAAVLAVMGQAAEAVADGAVWLQTSMDTDAERAAGLAQAHGITFVDCPVLGSRETPRTAGSSCSRPDPATPSTVRSRSSMRSRRDRQARPGGQPGEPGEARGERMDRGTRGELPRPAESPSAPGVRASTVSEGGPGRVGQAVLARPFTAPYDRCRDRHAAERLR
jgi:NAD binding domain of 6-phosphogluconate dehydrogenase